MICFSSSSLTTAVAIETSLAQFGLVITVNYERLDLLIAALLKNQTTRFASGIDEPSFNLLRDYICSFFQGDAKAFVGSVAPQLLRNLSQFLYFCDSLPSVVQVGDCYRNIEAAVTALEILLTASFMEEIPIVEEEDKHTPKKSQALLLDPRPFKIFGFQAPSSQIEADNLATELLSILKGILNVYLDTLRLEDVASAVKLSFIPHSVSEPLVHGKPTLRHPTEATLTEDVPVAYPKIQPMKSALHFDSINGFGEWGIFISAKADSELRSRCKKDRTSFDIIVKKINGSSDNQKRLGGPSSQVPIFEAKMTADLRLIYQIDIVANDDEREIQGWRVVPTFCLAPSYPSTAIKIFGIYTHAQMDQRMWHSISCQLGWKGKEYKDRCAIRVPADNSGDKTFVPALFPPLPEVNEDQPFIWVSEESEDNPVHSRFLMDKYVVFSQPLLNTMLADLDATFPHLVSVKEKQIIEHPYSCFVMEGQINTAMLLIERTHHMADSDSPKPRQIFVTQSRILAKKVEQYFVTLGRALTASSASLEQLVAQRASQGDAILDEEGDMIDVDDIVDWSGDLPSKFSELCDQHFPLFITFNGLCSMLEADIAATSRPRMKKLPVTVSTKSHERGSISVTYEVFLRDYWPHFTQSLTTKLDPSLVFNELIGVIKGSEETLEGVKHYLDPTTYNNLSSRNQSTFADNREDVYELFGVYLARKKQYGDLDNADSESRAHKILEYFKSNGTPGQKVDHLYVDESSFQFNSLKAFQWRLEQQHQSMTSVAAKKPETFQLSVNYRSHSGIVDCAHSIIELITRFWKDSIDRLAPEKGVVAGLKPLFFVGWNEEDKDGSNGSLDQFVFGDSGSRIEFGAQQCILVRNDAARDRLRGQLGDGVGLIMTIYDSKGLEFNDVLLYNFFTDSPAKLSQWRVILSALSDQSAVAAPEFERNRQRYASICTELKFLYVAITRARENVWIIDSSEKSDPIRLYWTEKDAVRNIKPGTKIPRLAISSSPEEWAHQGRRLFEQKKWAESKLCFERAQQPDRVAVAEAYLRREKAERTGLDTKSNIKLRNHRFCEAAKAFLECSEFSGRKRMLDFIRLAGNCYEKASEFVLAAGNYYAAHCLNDAVRCYRNADHYDEAVDIVQNEQGVDPSLVEGTIRVAKIFYFNQVQLLPSSSSARNEKLKQAGALFDDLDGQLAYLDDRGMDIARAALLIAHGRTREAAELHLAEDRVLEAIDLFIQDTESEESARRAVDCILDGLWRKFTFAVSPELAQDPELFKLLELAKRTGQLSSTSEGRNEIAMFRAIMDKNQQTLRELGCVFLSTNNLSAALLCLDHYFTCMPFGNLTVYQMTEELNLFRTYSQHLLDVSLHPKPADQAEFSKLFGFQKLSDSHVLLSAESYLHRTRTTASPNQNAQLSMLEFSIYFRACVSELLRDLFNFCHREASCHDSHVPAKSLTVSFYNARLRVHLIQMQIVRLLHTVNWHHSSPMMIAQRRLWLNRLYDSLYPHSHVLGTPAALQLQQIPEFFEAIKIVQEWVRDFVYKLPYYHTFFLSNLTRFGVLAMFFDMEYTLLQRLLYRGAYASVGIPPLIDRRGTHLVYELIGFIERNPNCLPGALITLCHVITESVPIEVGLLCDLLEKLCRSFILGMCAHRDDRLHNVTLPRSWLMSPISVEEERRKRFMTPNMLIFSIEDLLAQIYTGRFAAHLLYENQNLAGNIPIRVRTIFISRVCRAICLLGYNINTGARPHILRVISSLRNVRSEGQFPPAYRSYAEARSWKDVVRAVRISTKGSAFDEMVNIQHKSKYRTRPPSSNVRTVVYDNIEDLPKLLVGEIPPVVLNVPRPVHVHKSTSPGTSAPATSAPSVPSAWKTVGPEAKNTPVEDNAVATVDAAEAEPDDEEPDEQVEDVAQQAIPLSNDDSVVDQPDIPEPTEEEHEQASVIQQVYRRYMSRKAKQPTQIVESRGNWYTSYLKVDSLKPGRYRMMLLGSLPHALVFLELLYMGTQDLKAKTKKRTRLPLNSEQLDSLDKQLTQTNTALKKIIKWKNSLDPQSDLHSRHDCLELRSIIKEIDEFIRNDLAELSITLAPETRAEFDMSFRGIAKEPVPPKAVPTNPPKPTLNNEDVYEF
ncbi:hypothetical protein BDP27DRAFT_1425729 [Rhodocollybia butyracea]|uniref:UvrD-like helicase C-terminal domain-containing protein n=1 Tax=Rhodocollybia butyracea TaxID=206335 RepID=A0A9P5PL32_9AGAR|nr:hypothetical protein BDP27DRAFT_1425729 [Rhodocollybia butyracea]